MGARKAYSAEFRERLVALVNEPGRTLTDVAQAFDIDPDTLSKWRRAEQQARPGGIEGPDWEAISKQKDRELSRAREEIEILKKAAAYFAREGLK